MGSFLFSGILCILKEIVYRYNQVEKTTDPCGKDPREKLSAIQGKLENRKLPSPYWLICKIIQVGRGRAVSYF